MSSSMIVGAAFAILFAFGPVVALVLMRKSLGALNAAAALVTWGAIVVAGEHATFAITEARALASVPGASSHMRYHFYMAGIFTIVSAVSLSIIAHTLLREGQPLGWYAVMFALLFGGGMELLGGGRILRHGLPPDSIPMGLALYAYMVAWACALALSYRSIFGRATAGRDDATEASQRLL